MNRTSDLTRRLWAALLALCLTLSLALPVFAEGESNTEPEAKETYHIGTVDELLQLADYCRLDSWSENRTVVLDTDLEVTGSGFTGIPSFSGVFEGQGHVISGLSLVDDGSVIGFFRYVQKEANVRDLVVRGRAMPSGSRTTVGGLAGSNAGTLHNCRFEGVSSGASIVGGIAGNNLVTGVIENCTTTGSVYGAHFIGGLAGQNHGIIANSTNAASVNTTVEQNDIDLSELTLGDLIGTENAADITDIGGIAGQSSGVIRACMNRGTVGYQHMGYNVGGIAGSQTGYIEGCVNYGTVYARKESGGIVGQMEPSSTLQYTKDTLQELSEEMTTLQTLVDRACDDASAASSDLSNQLHNLQNSVTSSRSAIENLLKQAGDGLSISSQTVKTDLTQFKQNLKDTTGDASDPDATKQPDGAIIDPGYSIGDLTGSSSEEETTAAAPEESADTAPAEQPAVTEDAPAEQTDQPTAEDTPAEQAESDTAREAHSQPDPGTAADDSDPTVGPMPTPDQNQADTGYIVEEPENKDIAKDLVDGISDAIPDSVDVEIPKVELTNRDAITASKNDLSSNLTGIGDIVRSLNTSASGNSQALINDVRAISNQINKIGQTLSGASENVNRDADDIVDDISDEDTDSDVEAKVSNCINSGSVYADINAGGITGAMARENDLDPEDDYTIACCGARLHQLRHRQRQKTARRRHCRRCRDGLCHRLPRLRHGGRRGCHRRGRRGRCEQIRHPRQLRQVPPVRLQAGGRHCRQRRHHRKLPRHGHDRERQRADRRDRRYRKRPAGRQRDRQHLCGYGHRRHRQHKLQGHCRAAELCGFCRAGEPAQRFLKPLHPLCDRGRLTGAAVLHSLRQRFPDRPAPAGAPS